MSNQGIGPYLYVRKHPGSVKSLTQSGKLTCLAGKSPSSIVNTSSKGACSIAMLVYYRWWKKSCASWEVVDPIIYRVFSNYTSLVVVWDFFHQWYGGYCTPHACVPDPAVSLSRMQAANSPSRLRWQLSFDDSEKQWKTLNHFQIHSEKIDIAIAI